MSSREAIHLSVARKMMEHGERVSLRVVTSKGDVCSLVDVVSLKSDIRTGTRNVKLVRSGQIRKIRDVLIIGINDYDVFL